MALQFQPPPAWLMQEYMNQKSPVQEGMESAGSIANTVLQHKAMETKKQNDAMGIYVEAYRKGGPSFAMEIAKRLGLKNPPTPGALPGGGGPPAISTGTAPSPMPGGMPGSTPGEDAAQMSMSSEHPMAPQAPAGGAPMSPIIAHWNQTMGGQGGGAPAAPMAPPQPGMPQLPTNENPADLLNMGEFGADRLKGLESVQKLKDAQDAHDEKFGKKTPITKEGLLKKGSYDPAKDYVVEPASGQETRSERLGSSLRKELTGSKSYDRFVTIKSAAENIGEAIKNPGAYGDLGTLFDYMKILDPISVVREGEQQTFRKTGSMSQGIANAMNKLVTGETITPEQRKEVMRFTNNRLKIAHKQYKNLSDPTLKQAKRIGVDPSEVDPFYGQSFGDENEGPHGASVTQNGHTYTWNAEKGAYE